MSRFPLPRFFRALLCAVAVLVAAAIGRAALPAFPGAEGFGADTRGGRGGRVIEVTNLEDSGPGSLRAACEAEGPRIVVFRVGGTISLRSQITIRHPFITIAGQTAPGDGILIRKGANKVTPLGIHTHDVVIRCLRIRSGDSPDGSQTDCLEIHNAAPGDRVGNIIIDHCSFSWSTDENLAIMGRYLGRRAAHPKKRPDQLAENWDRDDATANVTVQWCIIAEGLDTPQVHKSRSALVKFTGAFSFHHNLMAHELAGRNPRLQGHHGTIKDVVNNVIYNTARYGTGASDGVRFNYVGNYMKSGANTRPPSYNVGGWGQPSDFAVYLNGNYHSELRASDGEDERRVLEPIYWAQVAARPFPAPPVRTTSAAQACEEVLRHAGCIVPRRDAVDERLVADVRQGTGRVKTSVADAGGYPVIAGGTPPPDTDHDGMPDAWEERHGLDPRNPADGSADRDGDGYTNIEEYLNSLIPPLR